MEEGITVWDGTGDLGSSFSLNLDNFNHVPLLDLYLILTFRNTQQPKF